MILINLKNIYTENVYQTNITRLIEDSSRDYDGGKLEELERRIEKSNEFTENLLVLLLSKGLLSEDEIKRLIEKSFGLNVESIECASDNHNEY